MATTLDLVSGGRLRSLIGAGWHSGEYDAFGFPFPPPGQRVVETEDAITICRGLFDSGAEPFSYDGVHHSVHGAVNVPTPARRIPIGVGCTGDHMLELTARLADEWNFPATALDRYDGRRRVLAELLPARNRPASCTSCWWFDVTMVVVAVLIEFTVNSDKPGEVWTSQPSKRRWWSRR